jgi:hypothetical protein
MKSDKSPATKRKKISQSERNEACNAFVLDTGEVDEAFCENSFEDGIGNQTTGVECFVIGSFEENLIKNCNDALLRHIMTFKGEIRRGHWHIPFKVK